jgi:flagellar biosynthesis GTPase FlhF
MQPFDPGSNERRLCQTVAQNIRDLSRERNVLRERANQARGLLERARTELTDARKALDDAKQRAQRPRPTPGGGHNNQNRREEQAAQAAELAEKLAEALLGDYRLSVRRKQETLRARERAHAEAERRWREADRMLLQQEKLYEESGCGASINHRVF